MKRPVKEFPILARPERPWLVFKGWQYFWQSFCKVFITKLFRFFISFSASFFCHNFMIVCWTASSASAELFNKRNANRYNKSLQQKTAALNCAASRKQTSFYIKQLWKGKRYISPKKILSKLSLRKFGFKIYLNPSEHFL